VASVGGAGQNSLCRESCGKWSMDNILPLLQQVPFLAAFIWFALELLRHQARERMALEREWRSAVGELRTAIDNLRTSLGAIIEKQIEAWRSNNGHFETVIAQEKQTQEAVLKTLCTLIDCINNVQCEAHESHARQQEMLARQQELLAQLAGQGSAASRNKKKIGATQA